MKRLPYLPIIFKVAIKLMMEKTDLALFKHFLTYIAFIDQLSNHKAKVHYKMVNISLAEVKEPPATKHICNEELDKIRPTALKLRHPCHNQAVERLTQIVSEASAAVSKFVRRDR